MMKENNWVVEFYETETHDCPVLEFINTLETKLRAKVFRDLSLLQEKGNNLRYPYSEHLDDGIFELRTILGSNIVRNLYFFVVGQKIIVTHGFRKKTQKTPAQQIEKAKSIRDDYKKRYFKNL